MSGDRFGKFDDLDEPEVEDDLLAPTPAEFLHAVWGNGLHSLCWGGEERFESEFFDNPADLIARAQALGPLDIWFGAHPLRQAPPRGKRGSASDVIEVVALHADLDWKDDLAHKATDLLEEEELRVRLHLIGPELYPSIGVHSGHGLQVWWPLDRAVTPEVGQDLLDRLTARLADIGLKNGRPDLASVLRLPGTENHKNPDLVVPVSVEWNTRGTFGVAFLIGTKPPRLAPATTHTSIGCTRPSGSSITDDMQRLADFVVEHHDCHHVEGRGGELYLWRPGKPKGEGHGASIITGAEDDAILTVYTDAWPGLAKGNYRMRADGTGLCHPSDIEGDIIIEASRPSMNGPAPHEADELPPLLVMASSVKAKRLRWAWEGRIPLGTVGLMIGYEGLGKSVLTTEITARLTRGELPGDLHGTPVDVVIVTAEDSYEATVVPRLMAAKADLDRVHFVPDEAALSLPRDLARLGTEMRATGARMVVLDPFTVHIGGEQMDSHKDRDVRRALSPVKAAMSDLDATCLGIVHWNKSQGSNPLDRIGGSRAWSAASRFHLGVGNDGEDTEQRILVSSKANLSAGGTPALTFDVVEDWVELPDGEGMTSVPRIVWTGERAGVRPEDLFRTVDDDDGASELDRARELIRTTLASGPVESKVLDAGAEAAGIKPRTLKRARAAERAKASRRHDSEGRLSGWIVSLPTSGPRPDGPLVDGPLVDKRLSRENDAESASSGPSIVDGPLDSISAPRRRSTCPSCGGPLKAVYGRDRVCADCFTGR